MRIDSKVGRERNHVNRKRKSSGNHRNDLSHDGEPVHRFGVRISGSMKEPRISAAHSPRRQGRRWPFSTACWMIKLVADTGVGETV